LKISSRRKRDDGLEPEALDDRNNRKATTWPRESGFTLAELMVTVVILGILAAIAIPNYHREVMSSRRTAAKTALLDLAGREEKYYSTNNAYTDQMTALGFASVSSNTITVPGDGDDFYTVTLLPFSGGSTDKFTAQARPVGDQTKDACGTFQIDSQGAQTTVGATTNGCW